MMRLSKGFIIICLACFGVGLLFGAAFNALSDTDDYETLNEVHVMTVVDWPPVSEKSIFYSGAERTPVSKRGILGLVNPAGTSITDKELNRYLVSGSVDIQTSSFVLQRNSRGQMRLCAEGECFSVSRKIQHFSSDFLASKADSGEGI